MLPTTHSIMTHARKKCKRNDSKPTAARSAVGRGASDALATAAGAMDFRATQL
jgi:hypothetical protein